MIQHPDLSYLITTDPSEADHPFQYGPELEKLLGKLHTQLLRKNSNVLPKLLKAIKKYPRVPALRNYLCVYYESIGKRDKALEINRRLVADYPDYLFGRLNLASDYLSRKEYDLVFANLGPNLDLQAICPKRKVFHIKEFEQYWTVLGQYYLEKDEMEAFGKHLQMGRKILGIENNEVKHLSKLLVQKTMMKTLSHLETDEDSEAFSARAYDPSIQTKVGPTLQHQELFTLYDIDLEEAGVRLQEFVHLPRVSLIEDLEKILWDSVARYEYWREQEEQEEEYGWFPVYALLLLRMLNAKEQLPFILELFRQGEELMNFWFGDWITEELWRTIYPLTEGQEQLLFDFLSEPRLFTYSKIIVVGSLVQRALNQPEEEAKIMGHFVDFLDFILANKEDIDLIDRNFNSSLCIHLTAIADASLATRIKQLYTEELVMEGYLYSSYTELEKDFSTEEERNRERRNPYEDNKEYLALLHGRWNK